MLLEALPLTNKCVGEQIKETIPKNGSSLQNLQNTRKSDIIEIIAIAMLKPL